MVLSEGIILAFLYPSHDAPFVNLLARVERVITLDGLRVNHTCIIVNALLKSVSRFSRATYLKTQPILHDLVDQVMLSLV